MQNVRFLGSILFVTVFLLFDAEGKYNRRGWTVADEATYRTYSTYCIKFDTERISPSPDKVYYQKDDEPAKNCSYFKFDFNVLKEQELLGKVVTSYLTVKDGDGEPLPTTEDSTLGQEDECYGGKLWDTAITLDEPDQVEYLMQQLTLEPMLIYDGYQPIPSGASILTEGCLRYIRLEFKPKSDRAGYPTLYSYAIITNPLVSQGTAPVLLRIVENFQILKHDRVAVNVEAKKEEAGFIKQYQGSSSFLKDDAKNRSNPPKPFQRSNSTGSYLPKEDVSRPLPVRQLSAPSIQVPSTAEVQFDDISWEEKTTQEAKQLGIDPMSEKIIKYTAPYKLTKIHLQAPSNSQKIDCVRFTFASSGKMDQYSYSVRRNSVIFESKTELLKSSMANWQAVTGKLVITDKANLLDTAKYSLTNISFTATDKFLYRKYEFENKNPATGCKYTVITYAKFEPDAKVLFATADYRKLEIAN